MVILGKLNVLGLLLYCLFMHGSCCPAGWMTHGPNCYHFSHDEETWIGALEFCRELKGQLVEINDASENAFLTAQVQLRKQVFWIGLSDVEEEGTWMWMNSRTKLTSGSFTSWSPGQPNNFQDNENCGCINPHSNNLWNDHTCYEHEYYICETTDKSPGLVG